MRDSGKSVDRVYRSVGAAVVMSAFKALHGAHSDESFDGFALSTCSSDARRCSIMRSSKRERRVARVHDVIAAGCREKILANRRRGAPLGQRVGLGRDATVAGVARLRSA
jgi:hypothetical protein